MRVIFIQYHASHQSRPDAQPIKRTKLELVDKHVNAGHVKDEVGEDHDIGLVTEEADPELKRPPMYKVMLLNDDYTPMEFVVQVLEEVFRKSPSAATQIMLQIHRGGLGVAGVYVLEVAETKSATVHRMAEERGFPLRTGVEKE